MKISGPILVATLVSPAAGGAQEAPKAGEVSRAVATPLLASPEIAANVVILKPREQLGIISLRSALASNRATRRFNFRQPVELGISGAVLMKFGPGGTVRDAIEALEASGLVEYAEPDSRVYAFRVPNDPRYPAQWGFEKIQAPLAWDVRTDSPLIVAVVDSGGDLDHPDLAANWWKNPGEVAGNGVDDDRNGIVDDVHGARFFNSGSSSGNPVDQDGHGTHVSGTIGAVTNNKLGVAGTSWSVKIIAVRFMDQGSGWSSDAARALSYSFSKGARVVNNSWGSFASNNTLSNTIRAMSNAGVLIVNAAGNSHPGTNNDARPVYPANYRFANTLSVAATTQSDTLASFSHFGPGTVDLGAPGTDIFSTYSNDSYGSMGGTSMASPHVAGSLALLGAVFSQASSQTLRALLLASVDDRNLPVVSRGRLNLATAVSGPFSITSPSENVKLLGGTPLTVGWTGRTIAGCANVTANVSLDGGQSFAHQLFAGSPNDGSAMGSLPPTGAERAIMRLACDGLHIHSAGRAFQIIAPLQLTYPNGGEKLKGGKTIDVRWNQAGGPAACPSVDVSLSRDGGTSYSALAAAAPNSGSATVKLPKKSVRAGLVMVRCSGTEFGDQSDASFTIKRPFPFEVIGIGLLGLALVLL